MNFVWLGGNEQVFFFVSISLVSLCHDFYSDEATIASTTFCLRQEKDDQKVVLEDKDLEVIGSPIIKYGDSTVIVQHCVTSLWLSYKVKTGALLISFVFKGITLLVAVI